MTANSGLHRRRSILLHDSYTPPCPKSVKDAKDICREGRTEQDANTITEPQLLRQTRASRLSLKFLVFRVWPRS